jgi:hypothetical protein
LDRPGGTFTTPKNITTPETFYSHYQNVIPKDRPRPPGALPPFITEISIPPGSLLPDPTIRYTPGGVWLPPNTPGATVTGIWIISEDSSGLFDINQIK